ncbi:MAG TPA: DUF4432 family protein [Planctomycetaceae bacterium]|nr:DUF4432 family protein [Planctomycetaceae bacterium]
MTAKTWTLTDVEQDCWLETIALSPKDVGGPASGYSVIKRTLQGGLRQGVEVIEVDNGSCRFVIIPTRGMGIWHALAGGVHLGWKSPVRGPVHPAFVRLEEPSGIGWLDGFDELLVRRGLESNGAPEFNPDGTLRYGLHGKIANIPAHRVEVTIDGQSGQIQVRGTVDESRLFGHKLRLTTTIATRIGQLGFSVTDVLENLSAEPSDLELLYHINFGSPLLEPGAKIALPFREAAPRDAAAVENVDQWDVYGPESPGSAEAVFFFDPAADGQGNSRAVLHNARADRGVSVLFNKTQLPCFTLWKNRQAAADGYVTGLEPATNYPNTKSFEKEKGRVVALGPGQSRTFQITVEVHPNADAVSRAVKAVGEIQGGGRPAMGSQPNPEWSQG